MKVISLLFCFVLCSCHLHAECFKVDWSEKLLVKNRLPLQQILDDLYMALIYMALQIFNISKSQYLFNTSKA
jgi:hypothetical protein